jgi:hypothetical protein
LRIYTTFWSLPAENDGCTAARAVPGAGQAPEATGAVVLVGWVACVGVAVDPDDAAWPPELQADNRKRQSNTNR